MPPRGCLKLSAILAAALLFLCGGNVRAVQVYGTSGTTTTFSTAPSDNFGFANVAAVYDTVNTFYTTGVYLGNGWMLSAYHEVQNGSGGFEFGNIILDGTNYSVNAATAVRLTSGTNGNADLAMYRLTTVPADPNLRTITISASRPAANSALILMGNGFNRTDPLVFWQVTGTNTGTWTWSGTMSSGNFSGYLYASGNAQSLRWGDGTLSGTTAGQDGFGYVNMIYSFFKNTNGSAMGAAGDSGGGVFYKRGANWELTGIIITINNYPNQPANTSVVGNASFAADLSTYSSQITTLAAVQEPVFTTQPAGITVTEGQSGTFTVSATAAPAAGYQWQRMPAGSGTWSNMADISGTYAGTATSTLVVSNATLAMNGDQFQCIASNGYPPDATSNAATLGVVTGYQAWAMHWFGSQYSNPVISSATSTPQGDGVTNAVKYLTDINPAAPITTPGYAALPAVSSVTLSGTQYLAITYRQSQSTPGLTLGVQTSPDLQSWQTVTPDSTVITGTDSSTGDPIVRVGVKTNGAQKLFMRLQINLQ